MKEHDDGHVSAVQMGVIIIMKKLRANIAMVITRELLIETRKKQSRLS